MWGIPQQTATLTLPSHGFESPSHKVFCYGRSALMGMVLCEAHRSRGRSHTRFQIQCPVFFLLKPKLSSNSEPKRRTRSQKGRPTSQQDTRPRMLVLWWRERVSEMCHPEVCGLGATWLWSGGQPASSVHSFSHESFLDLRYFIHITSMTTQMWKAALTR